MKEDVNELLKVSHLKTHFPIGKGIFRRSKEFVKAVDGISFKLNKGETLGIVGESGCGKSTMGRSILQLIQPTEGSVRFNGQELTELNKTDMRNVRGEMQIVFQDPYSSLNPKMTVGNILEEALVTHKIGKDKKE